MPLTTYQMKQLFIVRHAKSDWGDFSLKDFDRPLSERGHKNAPEMAQRFLKKDLTPELIVSSPALRAITTAKYFAVEWEIEPASIKSKEAIYEANTKTLLDVINGLDNGFQKIALFGHNPGLTDLLNYLTNDFQVSMSTCSVALIEFPFDDWKLISEHTGDLVVFDYPKSGNE